jgi:hypothetical protein
MHIMYFDFVLKLIITLPKRQISLNFSKVRYLKTSCRTKKSRIPRYKTGGVWWYTPIILVLRRLR